MATPSHTELNIKLISTYVEKKFRFPGSNEVTGSFGTTSVGPGFNF